MMINNCVLNIVNIFIPNYNNNLITLRVFESILSGSITFIDNDFDIKHEIFDNEFFYVPALEN